ncbi:LysR family transcriptional regulator [Conexibacter sp. CPCC 206217]|uniref:LysR family transcriptional regulator n=1 Tax=Conexibacter sp. CPCC 206217 TaxID=3064574 RepID=UPI002718F6E1|nr:LysR family transcriptional regulator [Conexibacter sp. CPCC 206217]MDO8213613.1 LysR family transcriptional regulator [Conexibacter sp. CPCC 206217]
MTEQMDFELLRTFVAVARAGSVNLAATELHMSQASVSRQVQRLEAAIGTDLFVRRGGRALVPTAAGRRILDPCMQLLDDGERQWSRLRALAGNDGRRLVVGLGPGIALLPAVTGAIASFGRRHPQVEAQLVEHGNSATALHELLDGTLDIAVVALRDERELADEIETVAISALTLQVLVRDDHRLAARGCLTLADIRQETFVFLDGSDGLELFSEVAASAELKPQIAHRCEQLLTLLTLLSAGDAIGILLGTAATAAGALEGPLATRLRTIPLDVAHPPVTLSVCWNAARPPVAVAHEVVQIAREVAAEQAVVPGAAQL